MELGLGARVVGVPTRDIRFAVPEIPLFSSEELTAPRDFSSAELLIEARDRCEAVVDELRGFRTVDVVAGRVGGLLKVLPFTDARVVDVVFGGPDMELGRFVVVPVGLVAVVDVGRLLTGEALVFSLSLETSGLVSGPSLPDMTVDSIGVAGGAFSESTSTGAATGTGSSVEAIVSGRESGLLPGSVGSQVRNQRWVFNGGSTMHSTVN